MAEVVGPGAVHREVHGPQLVGGQRPGVLDGPGHGQVELAHEHDHHVPAKDGRR